MENFLKKQIDRTYSQDPKYVLITCILITAFLIEKIAKYKKKCDGKLDLAYGKFSQKGNSTWIDRTYSQDPKYVKRTLTLTLTLTQTLDTYHRQSFSNTHFGQRSLEWSGVEWSGVHMD